MMIMNRPFKYIYFIESSSAGLSIGRKRVHMNFYEIWEQNIPGDGFAWYRIPFENLYLPIKRIAKKKAKALCPDITI